MVRKDLDLSPGKLAVQVAHASISALDDISQSIYDIWFADGDHQKKVVLQVEDEDELIGIMEECEAIGLPYASVVDAGRTEIRSGTMTCIGIGPHKNEVIDEVTRHLQIYR